MAFVLTNERQENQKWRVLAPTIQRIECTYRASNLHFSVRCFVYNIKPVYSIIKSDYVSFIIISQVSNIVFNSFPYLICLRRN